MSDMVERVAWTLKTAFIGYDDDKIPWTVFDKAARAAIEAMREPTTAMVLEYNLGDHEYTAQHTWGAMIDAALRQAEGRDADKG